MDEEKKDLKNEDKPNVVIEEELHGEGKDIHQEDEQSKSVGIDQMIKNILGKTPEIDSDSGELKHITLIQNLNYVDKNSGFVMGDHAEINDITFQSEKKCDDVKITTFLQGSIVENREVLIGWLKEHYNDFEMAFLISLAVFEKSPYLWVYEIAEDLYRMMEKEKEENEKNREKIPSNQRIEDMGGIVYSDGIYDHTGWVECDFLRFQASESAQMVLGCVWTEFIFYRETLIRWLEKYVSKSNYTKMARAIEALTILARLDFYYFEKNVIGVFFARKDFWADFAVAKIMIQVYEDERYKNNIIKQFKHWANSKNLHHLLAALQMCVKAGGGQDMVQMAVGNYLDQLLQEFCDSDSRAYEEVLPIFFCIGERKAVYYKAIVTVLYDKMMRFSGRKQRHKKQLLGVIFFILLQLDFQSSKVDVNNKAKSKDMIFVKMCLIKNEITPKLLELWKYIWKSREFHKMTEEFLERYLYQYGGCSQDDINYLRQFLYSFQDTEFERNNMEFFLRKVSLRNKRPVHTAERINNY